MSNGSDINTTLRNITPSISNMLLQLGVAKRRRKQHLEDVQREIDKRNQEIKLNLLLEGKLLPEQEQDVLSSLGIKPTAHQLGTQYVRDRIGSGDIKLSPEEYQENRQRQKEQEQIRLLQQLGLIKQPLVSGIETGAIQVPGLEDITQISPESVARKEVSQARKAQYEAGTAREKAAARHQKALANLANRKRKLLTTPPNKLKVNELKNAISATQSAINGLRRQDQMMQGLTEEESNQLDYFNERLRQLIIEQDKKLGVKSKPYLTAEQKRKRSIAKSQISQWQKELNSGKITKQGFILELQKLTQRLGGDQEAKEIIAEILGY